MSSLREKNILVIYEDAAIIVVEKPAGIHSCAAKPEVHDPKTVEGHLQQRFPNAKLVHRLDNDTSGLLVAAKTKETFENLRKIWGSEAVTKKYLALVLGTTERQGKIETAIAHHPRKKKKMIIDGEKARPAVTIYKTIASSQDFSLLEVSIQTGVRHQIRLHLSSIGHPIAGDLLYQTTKDLTNDSANLNRHFLHLHEIEFPHPETKKKLSFRSPLPKELSQIVQKLLPKA
ncbi:MAG: RluA family pseudouridine synthase [Deltaproteobacteria bacterium]|nr:RluA family pseudouridine synthase [Deltaproteobacteria bacterium]